MKRQKWGCEEMEKKDVFMTKAGRLKKKQGEGEEKGKEGKKKMSLEQ